MSLAVLVGWVFFALLFWLLGLVVWCTMSDLVEGTRRLARGEVTETARRRDDR